MLKRNAFWVVLVASSWVPLSVVAQVSRDPTVIFYVDDDAVGLNDGSSWENAFSDLQAALDAAGVQQSDEVVEIRVAQGLYKPSKRTDPADPRSATFRLPSGIRMIGGYLEPDPDFYGTVLSGDLLGDDQYPFNYRADNVYHVLIQPKGNESVYLSGLTVRSGYDQWGLAGSLGGAGLLAFAEVVLESCRFEDNLAGVWPLEGEGSVAHTVDGGAVVVNAAAGAVTWEDCWFYHNASSGAGGGLIYDGGGLTLNRCLFDGNTAKWGAALIGTFSNLTLEECSFRENRATAGSSGGGGTVNTGGTNLKISDCTFWANSSPRGGAIHLGFTDSVEILNSIFFENEGTREGGAIYLSGSSSGRIEDCTFDRNRSLLGGAIYFDHTDLNMPVIRSVFTNNHAQYSGGALYTDWSPLRVVSSTFLHNWAGDYGGVMSARSDSQAEDCLFDDNYADYGGALYLHGPSDPGKLVHNTFLQNDAIVGGGLSFYGGALAIDDCEFMQNHASIGGAMSLTSDEVISVKDTVMVSNSSRFGGAVEAGTGLFALENCTVANNSASTFGGGVLGDEGSSIRNCIFWDNSTGTGITEGELVRDEAAQIEGLGLIDVQYSIVEGWTGNYPGIDVRSDDPLFRIPVRGPNWNDPLYADLRLQHSSPAVNAGDPAYETSLGDLDLDGHSRVLCGRVDMGANESGIGDADCDGAVDLSDFAAMVECAEGMDEGPICKQVDFDNDGDFDLQDFAGMQRVMGEP